MKNMLPDNNGPNLDWALHYVQLGWKVFPVHSVTQGRICSCNKICSSPGKHPMTSKGFKEASSSLEQVKEWWKKWPKANIGIATGTDSGMLVVDVDMKSGGLDSLRTWEKTYGSLDALRSNTGGGGQHLFFNYPQGFLIKNRVSLVPGIDIRSDGGYVVVPPSVHASGQGYTWKNNQHLPEVPSWLLSYLQEPSKVLPIATCQNLIQEGQRNSFLASIAGSFRKFGLPEESITKGLKALNRSLCSPSLGDYEIEKISKSIAKYSAEKTWEKPMAFPKEEYSLPLMDESYIPGVLRPWVIDIAKRMQVPLEFVVAPAVVCLSSLIGRKVGIYPKQHDDWLVLPNLWGAVVARPGFFKSPTIAEALKPLEKIITKANEEFEQKKQKWEMEKSINEAAIEATKDQLIKAIKRGEDIDIESLRVKMRELKEEIDFLTPVAKRYKSNDATIEKIASILLENRNGILMVRDELSGWMASLGKAGREGDREFYLESWNGYGSFTIDRIGRGTTHIPSLCLSIFGGIQPSKLEKQILGSIEDNDDGLLQRFQILIYPEQTKEWKNYDVCPDVRAKERVETLFCSLASLEIGSNEPLGLHFAPEAQKLFNGWRANLEAELRSGGIKKASYESHLAKYRSLMPALALIFQLIELNGFLAPEKVINEDSAQLAIKWCGLLKSHVQKIYRTGLSNELATAKALANKIKEGKVRDGDSIRSIYRHHWSGLDNMEKIDGAINELTKLHWLRCEKLTGKRTQVIRLNPNL